MPGLNEKLYDARKQKRWSQESAAAAIGVDRKTYIRWEQGQSFPQPKLLDAACKTFGMSAIELGFALDSAQSGVNIEGVQEIIFPSNNSSLVKDSSGQHGFIDQSRKPILQDVNGELLAFFESTLTAQWDLYYMGGAKRAFRGLNLLVNEIERIAYLAQGSQWHRQALTLLTMVYQLQSCILRDGMQYPQAHVAYQRAFNIAQELEDLELMASALAREGVTLIQQDKAKQAILYLDSALNIIGEQNLPKLKGYVLQAFSEANAQVQQAKECWDSIDQAENIIVQPTQERSLVRFNTAAVVAQKGVDTVLLKDYRGAIRLIDNSLLTYDPTGIRSRARLIAQRAEAYYGLGTLDACVKSAKEALILARSVEASKTIIRIDRLHLSLEQSPWKDEESVAQLGAILNNVEK